MTEKDGGPEKGVTGVHLNIPGAHLDAPEEVPEVPEEWGLLTR